MPGRRLRSKTATTSGKPAHEPTSHLHTTDWSFELAATANATQDFWTIAATYKAKMGQKSGSGDGSAE